MFTCLALIFWEHKNNNSDLINFQASLLRNFLKEKNGTIILTALPKLLVTFFWFLKAPSNRETCKSTNQKDAVLLHKWDFKSLTMLQQICFLKSYCFKSPISN